MAACSHKPLSMVLAVLLFFVPAVPRAVFGQRTSAGTRMLVCESVNGGCSQANSKFDIIWTFNGIAGTATSSANSATSHLSIQKFDSDAIVVQSVDDPGPTAGLAAIYTGSVRGTQISGTVQWSWPGHQGYPATGTFSAVLQDQVTVAPATVKPVVPNSVLPPELLVCESNGACNAAWILSGAEGTGTWFARNTVTAKLAIVRLEPDYIVIRRTDTNDGVSASYTGSLRGDHWSGTIVWSSPDHPGDSTGTWTATVPQTTCDNGTNLGSADALRIGQNALMFHHDNEAFNCYIEAAKAGDATAQLAVGLIYYQGRGGISQDYKQAFIWLHKAADQGTYQAQRLVAEMYLAGQGTARDATLAGIYTARADEQKHDLERQQDRQFEAQQRAADRNAQVLSSFVLGASFGIFSDF